MSEAKLKVKLLAHTPEPEKLIAAAAKLCYSSVGIDEIMEDLTEDNIGKFLNILMDYGHESPIEHVSFSFGVEGVSRSLTHQLVRHRIASYSQKSQRYVSESHFEYIIPKDIKYNKHARIIFLNAMRDDSIAYSKLHESLLNGYIADFFKEKNINIDYPFNATGCGREKIRSKFVETNHKKEFSALNKRANENARSILPNACETKIIVTMNARALLNFLSHRECERAQDEIQQLAKEILKELIKVAPIVFKTAGAPCRRGKCPEGKMTCGRPKK